MTIAWFVSKIARAHRNSKRYDLIRHDRKIRKDFSYSTAGNNQFTYISLNEKICLRSFDKVGFKPACSATETS